jgi:hypothetical protein
MILLNLILGALVTTVGFWILWNAASEFVVVGWALAVSGFLWWKAKSVTEVWAWATLVLGLESFAWPLQRMIQLKHVAEAPSNDEMGAMLSDIVLGLFFSVFWMSFSYGLFKWAWKTPADEAVSDTMATKTVSRTDKRKKGR